MKIGSASGALYKRHQNIGYTPGSHYQRFGKLGLMQPRNMKAMNRQVVESNLINFENTGPRIFDAKASEAYGRSELAANQVIKRVQAAMNALADSADSVSEANGGTGSNVDETV